VSRGRIAVTVARVAGGIEELVRLDLPPGATAGDAAAASGLARHGDDVALAIYGRRARPGTPLADGDRVELCGPLVVTPADARRRRAAAGEPRRPAGDLPGRGK
jgi:hypothetical protein